MLERIFYNFLSDYKFNENLYKYLSSTINKNNNNSFHVLFDTYFLCVEITKIILIN